MKSENVPIPKNLKPAREGDDILITVPHYWGRGPTLAKAIAELRKQTEHVPGRYWRVWSVDHSTYVDSVNGSLHHPTEHPPVMLAESNPKAGS